MEIVLSIKELVKLIVTDCCYTFFSILFLKLTKFDQFKISDCIFRQTSYAFI